MPLSLTGLGIGITMLIAAVITLFGAVISYLWAPETRGLSLSECSSLDTQKSAAHAV